MQSGVITPPPTCCCFPSVIPLIFASCTRGMLFFFFSSFQKHLMQYLFFRIQNIYSFHYSCFLCKLQMSAENQMLWMLLLDLKHKPCQYNLAIMEPMDSDMQRSIMAQQVLDQHVQHASVRHRRDRENKVKRPLAAWLIVSVTSSCP